MSKDLNTHQIICSISVKAFPIQRTFWSGVAVGHMGLYHPLSPPVFTASFMDPEVMWMHVCVCVCLKLLLYWIFVAILRKDLWNPFQIWYYALWKLSLSYLCRQKGHNGLHMRIKTSLPWSRINWLDYTKHFNKCRGPALPLSFTAEISQTRSESIIWWEAEIRHENSHSGKA